MLRVYAPLFGEHVATHGDLMTHGTLYTVHLYRLSTDSLQSTAMALGWKENCWTHTLRCLCLCAYRSVMTIWMCVCHTVCSSLQATWGRGTYRCHSSQRRGVLCCRGWLVAGWIQFPVLLLLSPPTLSVSLITSLHLRIEYATINKHRCDVKSSPVWISAVKTRQKTIKFKYANTVGSWEKNKHHCLLVQLDLGRNIHHLNLGIFLFTDFLTLWISLGRHSDRWPNLSHDSHMQRYEAAILINKALQLSSWQACSIKSAHTVKPPCGHTKVSSHVSWRTGRGYFLSAHSSPCGELNGRHVDPNNFSVWSSWLAAKTLRLGRVICGMSGDCMGQRTHLTSSSAPETYWGVPDPGRASKRVK